METSAKTAVSDAFRTFTLSAFGLGLWNLPMIQWMIENLYSAWWMQPSSLCSWMWTTYSWQSPRNCRRTGRVERRAPGESGERGQLKEIRNVTSSDFQGYCRRWGCSKELLLQQITLVWLLKSGLKLQKGNCEKRFWITSTAGVRLKVTLRSLWLFTVIRKWLLKQQLAWSSLHAREHSTDLFTLFYSCPGHNHLGLLYVYLTNATSFMNSTTLPLKYRVHWVYISTWEVFEHFQDQCHLFYICWKHELCVIYY